MVRGLADAQPTCLLFFDNIAVNVSSKLSPVYIQLLLLRQSLDADRHCVNHQVQAHVAQTEVDPGAAVTWLHVTEAGMEATPTANQLIRSAP